MMARRSRPRLRARGFTLIETITVIALLGVAAAAIMRMQGNMFAQQSGVTNFQVNSRLQAECAELVLAVLRQDGIDQVTTTGTGAGGSGRFGTGKCDTLTAYVAGGVTYSVPTVTIDDAFTGAACAPSSVCKQVTVQSGGLQPLVIVLSEI